MLFYLAALQAIPTDVYEAAALDGTRTLADVLEDHVPAARPAHFFVLVVFGIGALKLFDQAFIVSGGRAARTTRHDAVLYIYSEAFGTTIRRRSRCRRRLLRDHLRPDRRTAPNGRSAGDRVTAPTVAAEPLHPAQSERPTSCAEQSLYVLMSGIALLFFVPFIWTVATSFKTIPDSVNFTLIPHPWTTTAWSTIWTSTTSSCISGTAFSSPSSSSRANIFLGGLGGYAFARLRFPGRELLFVLVLGTLMVPDQLRLIPVFVMLTNWHLIGNFAGYILINLVTATNLFFMRQYFLTIPKDFEEAAKLDGAGYFKTFWRVMLPLALPAIAALTILQFQGTWNDFFWPLVLFGRQHRATTPSSSASHSLRSTYSTCGRDHGRQHDRDPAGPDRLPRLPALLHRRASSRRG